MSNFKIEFINSPWLLLLLIPALFLTFFPYFRMAKRYRRTRNRIVSIVLHLIIMVLSISVLAGLKISFDLPNAENELVILVDSSFSDAEDETEQEKATFIYNVVDANIKNGVRRSKIAIVRFGYDQKVILGMGDHSADEVYDRLEYVTAEDLEDIGATDIRAALEFVWNPKTKESKENLIKHPQTAKILVVSDGLQTDEDALSIARSINSDGIRIDTTQFKGSFQREARIVNVAFPEQNLAVGEEFDFEVTIQSDFQGDVVLSATDEGEEIPSQTVGISRGTQTVRLHHTFTTPGHHELRFEITSDSDGIKENNTYYSYYDLIEFNKVLIIERYDDESEELRNILSKEVNEDNYFEVTTARYSDFDSIPKSVEEMRFYDQIILVNISHKDMEQIDPSFESNIEEYAYRHGGGVLTVGGQERDGNGQIITETVDINETDKAEVPKAHSYDRDDMKDTTYQKMLPVEVVDYTPPLALVIILDQSGSMATGSTAGAGNALEVAGTGALACVDVLSQRDWVGVMGIKDSYTTALDMTPCTQKNRIRAAIRQASQVAEGGTNYYPALDRACLALNSLTSVERKHIVLISDAQPADAWSAEDDPGGRGWKGLFERAANADISVSVVTIGEAQPTEDIENLCEFTHGRSYYVPDSKIRDLPQIMLDEITLPQITGVNASEKYHPEINSRTVITGSEITQEMLDEITMTGFFGTKAKSGGNVIVPLNAKLVPLYAQWQYGKGMVGSFMCDLHGVWSEEFINSQEAGIPIINNIVSSLMPTTNIRAQELSVEFTEDNYRTNVSVFDEIEEGKKLVAIVQAPDTFNASDPVKYDLSKETAGGNRFTFENKTPGIHTVTILKVNKDFDIFNNSIKSVDDIAESDYSAVLIAYRVFSYSEEYNVIREPDDTEGEELLKSLAEYGDGHFIEGMKDAEEVYEGFLANSVVWQEDLWTAFIIISLILFLLDVAVRKFKWKWPHEVVRDRKARKAMARN